MLTQKLILVLNQDLEDLHQSWFSSKIWIQENSAHPEVGFGPKSGFT